MGRIVSIRVRALLLLLYFSRSNTAETRFKDRQLYVGSSCWLADQSEGQCVKAVNCPEKIQQIRDGKYTDTDRCGFSNFKEIVCCSKTSLRPAGAACAKYANMSFETRPAQTRCPVTGRPPKTTRRCFELKSIPRVRRQIVGSDAREARLFEAPFMAALCYPKQETKPTGVPINICAGTLISEKHVITAAHCVSNVHDFVPNEVILGITDLTKTYGEWVQRITIFKIIEHPQYRRSQYYYDIAILILKDPAKFTTHVQPMCLTTKPVTSRDIWTQDLRILGWGQTSFDGETSDVLMLADSLRMVETSECIRSVVTSEWIHQRLRYGLNDGTICARDPNNHTDKSDTCFGDSGGPLYFNTTGFPTLVGITSFGAFCGTNSPGVYTSVYEYMNWIEEHVWPNETWNS